MKTFVSATMLSVLCMPTACAQAQSAATIDRACAVPATADDGDALPTLATDPVKDAVAQFWARPGLIVSDEAFMDTSADQWSQVRHMFRMLYDRGQFRLAMHNMRNVRRRDSSPRDIIHEASLEFRINPKVLVCTLQKEQGLLTATDLSWKQLNWSMGYAVCDGCSRSDRRVAKYSGFANQVHYAAAAMRKWMDQVNNSGRVQAGSRHFGPDRTFKFGSHRVKIENAATAVLYTYTPHVRGHAPFVDCWERYFPGTRGVETVVAVDDTTD